MSFIFKIYIVVGKSRGLIGAAECLTLYARCRTNRCRYKRVQFIVLGLLFNTAKKLFLKYK